jgi:hypothetical protein
MEFTCSGCGAGCVRSKTVVIAELAYARPSAADAEYFPAKPVLRSDSAPAQTGMVEGMKESHGEGLASHTGPESCAVDRKAAGEALTGDGRADRLSRENATPPNGGLLRGADALVAGGRPHRVPRSRERHPDPARSETPRTPGHTMRGSREIPRSSAQRDRADRIGKFEDARR